MTISAAFTVNGNPNPAGHTAAYASTVTLALTSVTGASSIVWEILASSKSDETLPVITRTGTPLGSSATFPLPADPSDGLGRAFLVKCTVSNTVDTEIEYGVVGAVNAAGLLPIVPGEENFRDATHGWSQVVNEALASTATPTPTTFGASVADLTALRAISSANRADNQSRAVGSPVSTWVFSSGSGAGFADDGKTIVRPDDVLLASNGRWYNAAGAPIVTTIDALRLAVSGKHDSVIVKSYSSAGDGGEGHFDYDSADTTSTDDGGIIIVAGTRRYKRRIGGHKIDVRWFGAKGNDPTHDDRSGIQAAEVYCQAHVVSHQTSGPSPNLRYTAPRMYLPGGRTWYIGRLAGFTHGLEIAGTNHIIADKGTVMTPRRVVVAALASNETFSATGHGFVVGEEIMFTQGTGTLPAPIKEATIYQVSATSFTANSFKLEPRDGGSVINLTADSSGTIWALPAMATAIVQPSRAYIEGIQFVDGYCGVALQGITSRYGLLGGFVPAEYVSTFKDCQFVDQAGPSVWQDLSPVTWPTNNRSMAPIKFDQCVFRGPCHWWGISDHLSFVHCTFVWDQTQLNADQDAGLPVSMRSVDRLPLGAINTNDNVFFDHCFIDPNQGGGGTKWPERRAFGVGQGNWSFDSTIWGELDGCLVRGKASTNGYRGLLPLADGDANFQDAIGSIPLKLSFIGQCLFDTFSKNIVEVYEQLPASIRFGRGDETNASASLGIWVDSSVAIADVLDKNTTEMILQSDYIHGPIVRWRQSTETDGFDDIGGNPWGDPIEDGPGITDVSEFFEAYWHHRPVEEWAHDSLVQENLWFTDIADVTIGGNPSTQVILSPAVHRNAGADSTNSSLGVAYTTFTTDSNNGGQFGWLTNKRWGATLPAGVYVLSLDILSSTSVIHTFIVSGPGLGSGEEIAKRHIVGDGRYHRYEFSFYHPGGSDTLAFAGSSVRLPAVTTMSYARWKIEPGRTATPYTAPVDVPAAPTTNTVSTNQPAVYWTSSVPATGVYKVGDRIRNPDPSPGEWSEQTCTTASTTSTGIPVFRVTATAAANPSVADVADTLNLVTILNNSGATVTAGDEKEFTLTVTGAKFGDDVTVTPLGYVGSKWDVYARISANDTVIVAIRNGTGSNAAIPTDAAGGIGVSVTVTQHPPFETFFSSPWSWLTGDDGYDAGTGDWTDQFELGHNAGPQATSSKRPTVSAASLNGHDTLAATRANATQLPTSLVFAATTTVFAVVEVSASASSVLCDAASGNGIALYYDFPGHSKDFEYLDNVHAARRTIGHQTTGWAVLGISINDAGNLKLYFNGAQVYNAAADGALVGNGITDLFNHHSGANAWNGRLAEFLVYHSAFTDAEMVDESARLKAKFAL